MNQLVDDGQYCKQDNGLSKFYNKIRNKKIIVFGYGRRGRIVGKYIPSGIAYFVDNDSATWQTHASNDEVCSPETLRQEDRSAICIVVVSYYYKAIVWQLEEMGFQENLHFINGLDVFGNILGKEIAMGHNASFDPTKVWLRGNPRIEGQCTFGGNNVVLDGSHLIDTTMERFSFVGRRCTICYAKIGKFCSIGAEVMIGLGRHPSRDFISTYPAFYMERATGSPSFVDSQLFSDKLPVQIGNDVWIGSRAMILGGIKVGDGAIIGAGALVTDDVESYSVVAGIPAKLLRMRYSSENIKRLLKFAWWNREIEWIRSNAQLFSNEKEFFDLIDRGKK